MKSLFSTNFKGESPHTGVSGNPEERNFAYYNNTLELQLNSCLHLTVSLHLCSELVSHTFGRLGLSKLVLLLGLEFAGQSLSMSFSSGPLTKLCAYKTSHTQSVICYFMLMYNIGISSIDQNFITGCANSVQRSSMLIKLFMIL